MQKGAAKGKGKKGSKEGVRRGVTKKRERERFSRGDFSRGDTSGRSPLRKPQKSIQPFGEEGVAIYMYIQLPNVSGKKLSQYSKNCWKCKADRDRNCPKSGLASPT